MEIFPNSQSSFSISSFIIKTFLILSLLNNQFLIFNFSSKSISDIIVSHSNEFSNNICNDL
jgi:hypothetical protein